MTGKFGGVNGYVKENSYRETHRGMGLALGCGYRLLDGLNGRCFCSSIMIMKVGTRILAAEKISWYRLSWKMDTS